MGLSSETRFGLGDSFWLRVYGLASGICFGFGRVFGRPGKYCECRSAR